MVFMVFFKGKFRLHVQAVLVVHIQNFTCRQLVSVQNIQRFLIPVFILLVVARSPKDFNIGRDFFGSRLVFSTRMARRRSYLIIFFHFIYTQSLPLGTGGTVLCYSFGLSFSMFFSTKKTAAFRKALPAGALKSARRLFAQLHCGSFHTSAQGLKL